MTMTYSDISYVLSDLSNAYSRLKTLIDVRSELDGRDEQLAERALREIVQAYNDLQIVSIFTALREQDLSKD